MNRVVQTASLLGRKLIQTQICSLCPRCNHLQQVQRRNFRHSPRLFGVFEPDDLRLGPEIPEYEKLVVQMKGYDFVSLESFASYAHNMAVQLDLNATCYAVPQRKSKIKIFMPNSTKVSETFELAKCERILELNSVPSTKLPLFIDLMRMNIPQSIEFTVKEFDEDENEFRYVPDKEMEALQTRLDDMERERENRKRR